MNQIQLSTNDSLCEVDPMPKSLPEPLGRHAENGTGLNMANAKTLRWFAGPDGVHRLRESADAETCEHRAAVRGEFHGFAVLLRKDGADQAIVCFPQPTLELAKDAAERAVALMDGEGL